MKKNEQQLLFTVITKWNTIITSNFDDFDLNAKMLKGKNAHTFQNAMLIFFILSICLLFMEMLFTDKHLGDKNEKCHKTTRTHYQMLNKLPENVLFSFICAQKSRCIRFPYIFENVKNAHCNLDGFW